MIISRTPVRVSFFGGGTDFQDFYQEEGGCVLATAINKYVYVVLYKRYDSSTIKVAYTKTEIVGTAYDLQHELVREALSLAGIQTGVEVVTLADIPSQGSGLGSSSALTVGLLNVFFSYLQRPMHPEVLAERACQIEIGVLRHPIGKQDQYITALGGLRFIEFRANGGVAAESIPLSHSEERSFFDNLLLFDLRQRRRAEEILNAQRSNMSANRSVLRELRAVAYRGLDLLVSGQYDEFGDLLHTGWELKKRLAPGISTSEIDAAYDRARAAGALGGKVTGAGGGGFLLLYAPRDRQGQVREALGDLREVPFRFEPAGTRIILNM